MWGLGIKGTRDIISKVYKTASRGPVSTDNQIKLKAKQRLKARDKNNKDNVVLLNVEVDTP